MKRQNRRKFILIMVMLLFPVTIFYFSPALIISAGMQGIINGSFLVFLGMFLLSIPFGRLFCAYLCPGGGIQECAFTVNANNPRQGKRNNLKYLIWVIWIAAVALIYLNKGRIAGIDFFYQTDHGISISNIYGYIIYYGIVLLIFVPAVLAGKRTFCHYFCWMAPFMILGTKLRRLFHLPGLHVAVKHKENCISCGKCSRECPMGIDVINAVKEGRINSVECIQCGACIDACPKKMLNYSMK